jgi:hypothetical protein
MFGFAVGKCRFCGAPLSHFALRCARCHASNQPNAVALVCALGVVFLVVGSIALGIFAFSGRPAPQEAAKQKSDPVTDPRPDSTDDYGWIVKAMAECDEEAKIRLDTMYFLIVPVTTTGTSLLGWAPTPISPLGKSAALLNSTDTLIGLRNRVLALYTKPLTFAVSDPASNTVFRWKPSVGVTSLKTQNAGWSSLTLGFEIADLGTEIAWGPTINLNKGSCYWINPIIRTRVRSG